MVWLSIVLLCLAIGTWGVTSSLRSTAGRRHDRLESAFFRARGQRMVSNGIRTFR